MKTTDMPVIDLQGTPRERGLTHGELLKPQIAEVLDYWLSDLGGYGQDASSSKRFDSAAYLEKLFSSTNYLAAIKQWSPHLLEEIKAIAEASDQPFQNILGLNLMDEEWVFGLRNHLSKPNEKCTAFAMPPSPASSAFAGQNMDICSWSEGCQTLFRIAPTNNSPEILTFAIAGNIGFNGINAAGLGVTCNTLSQLEFSNNGLPVAFMVRLMLEQPSINGAIKVIQNMPHASGQNYILSSAEEMHCYECSSKGPIPYAPQTFHQRIFHTNHPLVNKDYSSLKVLTEASTANTECRLDSITKRLGDKNSLVTLDTIKAALSAHDNEKHPVSRSNTKEGSSIGYTAGSVIYEFTPQPRLHLAAGPPCKTDYSLFEFKATEHSAQKERCL